jgi:hypothetical protein
MATATIASTGTMQSAQTHPLNAAGFDKTILLMTTLITTKDDEHEFGDKYSALGPNLRDNGTPLPSGSKV